MTTAAEAMIEHLGIMQAQDSLTVAFRQADLIIAALLAQTPDGEPVVILADGTLARLEETWDDSVVGFERLYRLVPLTGEP